MKKYLKDIVVISIVLVIALVIYLVTIPTKKEGSQAIVYYRNKILSTIDFNTNKINITNVEEGYPVISDTDEPNIKQIIVLGDYKVDNKKTLVYIDVDFNLKRIRIKKDESPYQIAVNRGWYDGNGLPLISAPNSISIIFEDSLVDGAV
ncbi:conserved hypothetical protein [Alteracholeplasma palmae J233]|uniref:Uncharacterized protein n=1 Tax=Alteracholeplasma palmae (strain ATCC 49389 / J233) TaxID=1318466 RepID=U4KLW5_ALTPJ|nr:NusG domain II-containing protein [Alteracholeplasma palmae]CCV64947.1 conserved hypothetical protein [Alteracholeplasma palmae J233]